MLWKNLPGVDRIHQQSSMFATYMYMYVEKKATGDLKLNEQFIHLGGERYRKGNEPKYTTQCPWPWLEPAQPRCTQYFVLEKNPKQTRVLIGLKPCFYNSIKTQNTSS